LSRFYCTEIHFKKEKSRGCVLYKLSASLHMLSLMESLESCTLYEVCSFLDPCSLGSVEAAAFDRHCIAECWKALQVAAERQLICRPWWKKQVGFGHVALPANNKDALREIKFQLRNLVRVPESWTEYIRKQSETVIEIQPRLAESVSTNRGLHHGGTEGYVGPSDVGGPQEGLKSEPPVFAVVPLSIGGRRGERFAVGVRLVSKRLSSVGEAVLLGAEFLTVRNKQGQVFSCCFSPVSGRIFIRFPTGEGMWAQALPDIFEVSEVTEVEGIEAFMQVSASGGISFGRRSTSGGEQGNVEWSGELPPEFLPPLSLEKHASLTFQVDKLLVTAEVSITWAETGISGCPGETSRPQKTFDSVWRSHEW